MPCYTGEGSWRDFARWIQTASPPIWIRAEQLRSSSKNWVTQRSDRGTFFLRLRKIALSLREMSGSGALPLYERSSCGVVARTGWLREVTEGLSFLDCGKSPYLLGKCQGVGLCHYSFTVKLKCHVFFCSTCIILYGEIHMDNCTTPLV